MALRPELLNFPVFQLGLIIRESQQLYDEESGTNFAPFFLVFHVESDALLRVLE